MKLAKNVTLMLVAVLLLSTLFGGASAHARQRETVTMWFWGAPPEHQVTMNEVLVEPYNASQDEYELVVEFRNTVDNDIAVALAAGEGPDIVYGSGPSFVAPYAAAGKLESMDRYSEQYGWRDRILAPIYESGTVNGELYALPNSLNTLGIFYNKAVLEEHGWEPPTTIEELEAIMDAAMEEGLYASVTGNKGWRLVNENYTSLFLTHMAGPGRLRALHGERPWNSPEIAAAIEKSAEWYQKGYLAGEDYINLNFNDACNCWLRTSRRSSSARRWSSSLRRSSLTRKAATWTRLHPVPVYRRPAVSALYAGHHRVPVDQRQLRA